jgi:small conductance mechanosensitive channel
MVIRQVLRVAARYFRSAGLVLVLLSPTLAVAQSAKPAPPPASETEIRALIATLEDEAERGRLVAQLRTLLAAAHRGAAQDADADVVDAVSARLSRLSENLVSGAQTLLEAPGFGRWLSQQAEDPARRRMWLSIVIAVTMTFAAGMVAEWLVRLLLARPRRLLENRDSDRPASASRAAAAEPAEGVGPSPGGGRWFRLPFLIAHTALDLAAVAAFCGAAYFTMAFVEPDALTRKVTLAFVTANVVQRAIHTVGRALLAPQASGLRVLPLSDGDAAYLFVWVRRFANITIYGRLAVEAAAALGVPPGAVATLRLLLGLVVALLVIVLVLQNRTSVAGLLAGAGKGAGADAVRLGIRRRFADVWHVAAIGYVVAVFLVWGLEIRGGFEIIWQATALTAVIAVAAVVGVRGLERLLRRAFDIGEDTKRRLPGFEARANRYLAIVHHVLRAIVYAVAAFAVLEAWGVDAFGWFASDLGRRVLGAAATVALLAVLAVIVWELASTAIERRLQAAEREPGGAGARALTLLPLLRTIILVTLASIVVMVALSQIGVDIGPLLAGAGIIGLAVGFGAQTLVKDIITGMFILLENQIAVGDVVKIKDQAGLVEALTIRTIRLRDLNGNVFIVPFSEVTTVENMTKDYSRYVFDVGVSYDSDVDQVMAVLREIGAELQSDPKFRDHILQPLEILGLERFEDSAVVVRARITTRPIKQWDVGREFNRRMKKRFDELGIQFPFPQRTVRIETGDFAAVLPHMRERGSARG